VDCHSGRIENAPATGANRNRREQQLMTDTENSNGAQAGKAPYAGEETFRRGEYNHATAKAHAMFVGWVEGFQPILATHEVMSVEEEFSFPLLNPETERASKTFVEAGKIDGILRCRSTGAIKVLEHKTTSEGIDAGSDYWERLAMDGQISKYVMAAVVQGGHDVRSVVYDVAKKPGQRPLRAGKPNEETPEEFHRRCLEVIREEPASYFTLREIPRSDSDLLEYRKDAWSLSRQILYYRREKIWPRNPSACTAYGQCEFFDLCAGRASVDGIRFARKAKKHAELSIEENGKDFLTNSRLTALRKCTRFYFNKYEEAIGRVGEDAEALRLGSSFHAGCEAYLKTFIGK
jgi:hypothetical protein